MIEKFILNEKKSDRQNVIWNMVATITNSFQSMLILLVLTQLQDLKGASYIAIGYASANLLMTIGKFGVRNYQVTDVREENSFSAYVICRFCTLILMLVGAIIYGSYFFLFRNYSIDKLFVVELLCLNKMVESFEDVFHGRLQQIGKLHIGSKIWAIRNIVFILGFTLLFILTQNLVFTLVINDFVTIILAFFLNSIPRKFYGTYDKVNYKRCIKILASCFSIAIATFLLMYISNAPKYIIDSVVSDEEQAKINVLLMVIYVVTLLSNFIFNPLINKMAIWYENGSYKTLLKQLSIISASVIFIVLFGIGFAEIIGRSLLGWIYRIDLDVYHIELLLVIISGGFIALINLYYLIIIMLRKQYIFYSVFGVASVILYLFGKRILLTYDFYGLCLFYILILFGIVQILIICSWYNLTRQYRKNAEIITNNKIH